MNIRQVKESWTLESLLKQMGHSPDPKKSKGQDLWYRSPFRPNETKASFHINTGHNIWKDFGLTGISGGDMICFVQRFLEAQGKAFAISDALEWFRDLSGGRVRQLPLKSPERSPVEKAGTFKLLSAKPLFSKALFDYLTERRIDNATGQQFLKQVYFLHRPTGRKIYGLGIVNEEGGYEVRNPVGFKGVIGAKAISYIPGQQPTGTVEVFEGFFDFLSRCTLGRQAGQGAPGQDSIILHSNTMYEAAARLIRQKAYTEVRLWLDNDQAGQKGRAALIGALEGHSLQFSDMNHLYSGYKDLNAWHQKGAGARLVPFSFQQQNL